MSPARGFILCAVLKISREGSWFCVFGRILMIMSGWLCGRWLKVGQIAIWPCARWCGMRCPAWAAATTLITFSPTGTAFTVCGSVHLSLAPATLPSGSALISWARAFSLQYPDPCSHVSAGMSYAKADEFRYFSLWWSSHPWNSSLPWWLNLFLTPWSSCCCCRLYARVLWVSWLIWVVFPCNCWILLLKSALIWEFTTFKAWRLSNPWAACSMSCVICQFPCQFTVSDGTGDARVIPVWIWKRIRAILTQFRIGVWSLAVQIIWRRTFSEGLSVVLWFTLL